MAGFNTPVQSGQPLRCDEAELVQYDPRRFFACNNPKTVKDLRLSYRHLDKQETRNILVAGGRELLNEDLETFLLKSDDLEGCEIVEQYLAHFWQYELDDPLRTRALRFRFKGLKKSLLNPRDKVALAGPKPVFIDQTVAKVSLDEVCYLIGLGYINPNQFVKGLMDFREKNICKFPEYVGVERTMHMKVTTKEGTKVLGRLSTRLGELGINIGSSKPALKERDFVEAEGTFEQTNFTFPCCSKMGEVQIRAVAREFADLDFVVDVSYGLKQVKTGPSIYVSQGKVVL